MGVLSRSGAAAAAAVAVVAAATGSSCEPEIGSGTYFCGPDMFCPPDLDCNPNTFTCDFPGSFDAFACPPGSEAAEPDDDVARAAALGEVQCADSITRDGCIPAGDDVDLVTFDMRVPCAGADPHLSAQLQFPIATVPLTLELVDDAGEVRAVGEPCTPDPNFTGMESVCIDAAAEDGAYFLRVRARDGAGGDCDGACRFNQYRLFVRYPVS